MGIKKSSIDYCRKKPVSRNNYDFINQKDNELNKNGYIIAQGSSIIQGRFDEKSENEEVTGTGRKKGIMFSCSEQAKTV